MHHHVMADIETLGRTPGSVVWQIAVVLFDMHTGIPAARFEADIDIQDSLSHGLTIEPDTAQWWEDQGGIHQRDPRPLEYVLHQLSLFLQQENVTDLWIWGLSFDIPLLKHLYTITGIDWPIPYWKERDARTLYHLAFPDTKRPHRTHGALADCLAQINDLHKAHLFLKGKHSALTPH